MAAWVVSAVTAVLLLASPLHAQRRLEVEVTRIDWGVAGKRATSLEWTPIVVHVLSTRGPVSGVMTVATRQDDLHEVEISTGFAAVPDKDTPIEVAVPFSWGASSVSITFEATDPWRKRTIEYSTASTAITGSGPRSLPLFVAQRLPSVWVVGDVRLAEKEAESTTTQQNWGGTPATPPTKKPEAELAPLHEASVLRLEPSSMPGSWISYRSADAVVVRGDLGATEKERVPEATIRALMDWVHSGGSLFVIVDGAGTEWRRFVESPMSSGASSIGLPPVEAMESSPVALPGFVGGAIDRWNAHAKTKQSDAKDVEVASSIRVRALRLTDEGRRLGWTLLEAARLKGDDAESPRSTRRQSKGQLGLIATGPVGLGMVTLVGFDPTEAPRIVHSGASAMVWDAILSPTLDAHWKSLNDARASGNWYGDYNVPRASSDLRSAHAIVNCLESVSVIPPVGHSTFLTLGLVVLVLGLLLGPGDMLWLKFMKWRQHWWISALGWIVIATWGAWFLPKVVRAAPSAMFRLTQEDVIDDGSGHAVAWRDGVTGIFAGRYIQVKLEDPQAGTWWRPVQPEAWSWRDRDESGEGRRVIQLDHLWPSPGSPRQCTLAPLTIPQWTARTFVDSAPAVAANLPVSFELRSSDGEDAGPEVVVKTQPGWTITQPLAFEVGNTWITFASTEPLGSGKGLVCSKASGSTSPPKVWGFYKPDNQNAYMNLGTMTSTDLIGPRERTHAIDAMKRSGRWGVMHLMIAGDTDGVVLGARTATREEHVNTRTTRSLRVLVPLNEEFKAALARIGVQPQAVNPVETTSDDPGHDDPALDPSGTAD